MVELFQTQFDSCVFRVEYYLLVESYDDLSDWNRGNKIETKREKISNILLDLSSEQDNEQKMNIPSIQCQSGEDLTTITQTCKQEYASEEKLWGRSG